MKFLTDRFLQWRNRAYESVSDILYEKGENNNDSKGKPKPRRCAQLSCALSVACARLLINEPLPGRITRSRPTGSKCNISSHPRRRNRSPLLDAPLLAQPDEMM